MPAPFRWSRSASDTAQSVTPLPLVAVAGSPNAGKSALFNALTGARQKVGNYPGVTVERHSGRLTLAEFEERAGLAYAAKTWDDLRALVADLPVQVVFSGQADGQVEPGGAGGRGLVTPAPRDLADRLLAVLPIALTLAMVALAVGAVALRIPIVFPLLWVLVFGGGMRVFRSARWLGRGRRHW